MTSANTPSINSVLLVDDNEDDNFIHTRQILISGLVSDKESVFVSWNGKEALAFLEDYEGGKRKFQDSFPPKLILLDINMPIMNGFEFLEAFEPLSQNNYYDSIVIVMLTSSENPVDHERTTKYSCVKGYYSKPINQAKLAEIARKYFA